MPILSPGFAAGSVAGGFLIVGFGWTSVMFINVPIGIVAAIMSQKFLPNAAGRLVNGHLDLPGALTVTGGLLLLVYALTVAATDGISSLSTMLPLAFSVLALGTFVVIECRSIAPFMTFGFLRIGTVMTDNDLF